MRAKITLRDVFGSGHLFSARASFASPGWLSHDPAFRDFLTGTALAVADDLPILVSARVADPQGLDLLASAGLEIPNDLRTYDDEQSHRAALDSASERLVFQHVHPKHEVEPARCWVDPALVSFLNNKANLADLAPAESIPPREVLARGHAIDEASLRIPCVIKIASDESSAGGYGIRLCHTTADVRAALRDFARCDVLVVEEFLPITRSFCVQFATTAGSIVYLGAPEQIVDAAGAYVGSWFEPRREPLEEAIDLGRRVMNRAVSLGYRGFGGIDVVELEDGRFIVMDLNFRMNGSTTALLLSDAVAQREGSPVMRAVSLRFRGKWDDLIRVTETAIRDHHVIPMCTYRPPDRSGEPPRLQGMVTGSTRTEVNTRLDELKLTGFE